MTCRKQSLPPLENSFIFSAIKFSPIYQFLLMFFSILHRDGQFRIPNPKDSNPKLSESNNRIWFISCLQALSRCLVTDFLFVKVSITCSVPSKILVSV